MAIILLDSTCRVLKVIMEMYLYGIIGIEEFDDHSSVKIGFLKKYIQTVEYKNYDQALKLIEKYDALKLKREELYMDKLKNIKEAAKPFSL